MPYRPSNIFPYILPKDARHWATRVSIFFFFFFLFFINVVSILGLHTTIHGPEEGASRLTVR